jgi:hypothetical protein
LLLLLHFVVVVVVMAATSALVASRSPSDIVSDLLGCQINVTVADGPTAVTLRGHVFTIDPETHHLVLITVALP